MLLINLDIENRLINGEMVNISYIQFVQGSVWKYMSVFPMKKLT